MPTTIRLTDELRARLSAAAERQGQTPHAYMLAALEEKAAEAEAEAEFLALAQARWAQFQKDGKALEWDEVRERWRQRVQPKPAKRRA